MLLTLGAIAILSLVLVERRIQPFDQDGAIGVRELRVPGDPSQGHYVLHFRPPGGAPAGGSIDPFFGSAGSRPLATLVVPSSASSEVWQQLDFELGGQGGGYHRRFDWQDDLPAQSIEFWPVGGSNESCCYVGDTLAFFGEASMDADGGFVNDGILPRARAPSPRLVWDPGGPFAPHGVDELLSACRKQHFELGPAEKAVALLCVILTQSES